MRQPISDRIRQIVAERANFKCEYCRVHSDDMFLSFEIDHIIPVKHGGANGFDNLAFACPHCNQHKGSDFATIYENEIIRLYNPRIDNWLDHFGIDGAKIVSKSKFGEASIKIFRFNEPDLLILRQILKVAGRYY